MITTSRTDFNETWLTEMPSKLGAFPSTFQVLADSINEWVASGHSPEQVAPDLFKLTGQNIIYFWYQKNNDIVVAVELEKRSQGLAVSVVGKNPQYANQPPHATDLYSAILSLVPQSLLFSDKQLSDDGINLWKKLMVDPTNKISVYTAPNPGQSFKTLSDPKELDDYLGPDHYNDRFVLSKHAHSLEETRSYFNTRRYRELSGLNTKD